MPSVAEIPDAATRLKLSDVLRQRATEHDRPNEVDQLCRAMLDELAWISDRHGLTTVRSLAHWFASDTGGYLSNFCVRLSCGEVGE
jgi:hypothetical protein